MIDYKPLETLNTDGLPYTVDTQLRQARLCLEAGWRLVPATRSDESFSTSTLLTASLLEFPVEA